MIREFIVWVSEALFYLTNGVMLINTPWFLAWVLFWSVMMAMPLIYATSIRPKSYRVAIPLLILFALSTLFAFTTAIAPGIVQQQMMMECKDATVNVNTELVGDTAIQVRHCRTKENFYGDFGEWKLLNG
jgi:hypothetical protein